jgi:hypothetical protein
VKGYPSIGIDGSLNSKAEDILHRLKWRSHLKLSKQRSPLFQCALKPEVRNLLSGRVNLAVVISMDHTVKHPLGFSDVGHIFSDTGSYESVLKPGIGPLNLPPGLGRQGIGHLDVAVMHHLFPLGIGLIGKGIMLTPERVSALDEPKDRMRVYIVEKRSAIVQHYRLQSKDMSPRGLFLYQGSIEDKAAEVI